MKTPISYYGGKQTLLKHILPLIPKHKLYTEAFCGGAAVLFAKRPADGEVIYANKNGWIIHRVERTISASKTSRRKQEEWMVCNYEEHPQRTLFDYKDCGVVDTTDAS